MCKRPHSATRATAWAVGRGEVHDNSDSSVEDESYYYDSDEEEDDDEEEENDTQPPHQQVINYPGPFATDFNVRQGRDVLMCVFMDLLQARLVRGRCVFAYLSTVKNAFESTGLSPCMGLEGMVREAVMSHAHLLLPDDEVDWDRTGVVETLPNDVAEVLPPQFTHKWIKRLADHEGCYMAFKFEKNKHDCVTTYCSPRFGELFITAEEYGLTARESRVCPIIGFASKVLAPEERLNFYVSAMPLLMGADLLGNNEASLVAKCMFRDGNVRPCLIRVRLHVPPGGQRFSSIYCVRPLDAISASAASAALTAD